MRPTSQRGLRSEEVVEQDQGAGDDYAYRSKRIRDVMQGWPDFEAALGSLMNERARRDVDHEPMTMV